MHAGNQEGRLKEDEAPTTRCSFPRKEGKPNQRGKVCPSASEEGNELDLPACFGRENAKYSAEKKEGAVGRGGGGKPNSRGKKKNQEFPGRKEKKGPLKKGKKKRLPKRRQKRTKECVCPKGRSEEKRGGAAVKKKKGGRVVGKTPEEGGGEGVARP